MSSLTSDEAKLAISNALTRGLTIFVHHVLHILFHKQDETSLLLITDNHAANEDDCSLASQRIMSALNLQNIQAPKELLSELYNVCHHKVSRKHVHPCLTRHWC